MSIRWYLITVSLALLVAVLAQGIFQPTVSLAGVEAKERRYKCGAHVQLTAKREKNKAGDGEFPFLVNITVVEQNSTNPTTLNQNLVYNCTGAIITNRRILTSIKCIGSGRGGGSGGNGTGGVDVINNTSSNVQLMIRAGSPMAGGGKLLKIKRIHTITYDLYTPDEEEEDRPVRHGLALIRLSSKIKYKLINGTTITKGHHKRKHRKNHRNRLDKNDANQLSINRACFNYTRSFPGADVGDSLKGSELFAPNWFPNYKQAKAIWMEPAKCPDETRGRAICVNLATDSSKNYGSLQEGTPLVRYTGKKRWEIIGVHSRRFEPWADCDDDRCATEAQNFIPVHEDRIRDWLYKTIYVKTNSSSSSSSAYSDLYTTTSD